MAFEVNTLFLLTIDVEAILGLLLLFGVDSKYACPRGGVVGHGGSHARVSVMMYGLSEPCRT